jgi:hypothetical protein
LDDKFFGFLFSDKPGGVKQQVQEIQMEEKEGKIPKSLGKLHEIGSITRPKF